MFPPSLVITLLGLQHTYNVVLFPCSIQEKMEWLKYISKHTNYSALTTGLLMHTSHKNICDVSTLMLEEMADIWHGLVLNFDCNCNQRILENAPPKLFRNVQYKWILWSANNSFLDQFARLNLNLTFESQVFLISAHSDVSIIYDVFKFASDWPLNTTVSGYWSHEKGLTWLETDSKAARRKNMHGIVFSVGLALPELGVVSRKVYADHHYLKSKDYYGRRDYSLWELMAEMHNITSSVYVADNYGNPKTSMSLEYNGFIGKLQRRELDVGFSVIRNTNRMKVVDYVRADIVLPPVNSINRAAFVFFEPVTLVRWRTLLDSFKVSIWLSIGFISLLSAYFFKVGLKLETNRRQSFCELFLFVSAIISQQGLTVEPGWTASRLTALSYLIFCFLVYNYFSTALIISLLSPPITLINNLRDLIDSNLNLGSEDIPYNKAFFKSYNISILNEAYEKKMKNKNAFMPLRDGLSKVQNESFAFEADIRHLFYEIETLFTDNEKCKVRVIDIFPFKVSRSLVLQKDSYYNEFISTGLILLLERGITSHVERVWDVKMPECFARDYVAAGLNELLFAFVILFVGFVSAVVALFIEKRLSSHCARKNSFSS